MGRRWRRWAVGLLAIGLVGYPPVGMGAEAVDLELVFAADGSGSIDDDELRLQREGYAQAITHPRILQIIRSGYHQAIAVGYTEWGGPRSQHTIVEFARIHDEASARTFADALVSRPRAAQGYNSISGAIDHARALIEGNGFEGRRKVIDVSGDGPHSGGRPVETARDEAVRAGITINALVIDSGGSGFRGRFGEPLDQHYARNVIGGPGAFVMVVKDRRDFADSILRKMIREIADGTNGDPGRELAADAGGSRRP